MSRLFISYRRGDAANDAGRLAEHLRARFGNDNVFIDVDTIGYGEDFVVKIQQGVGSCDVLLAVIGRGWLAAQDDDGRRRLDDPSDFVRLEIKTALERNIRVVPILVQRAALPKPADLPPDLADLLRRNAVELRETQFARDVDALADNLEGQRRSALVQVLARPSSWAIAAVLVAALVAAGVLTQPWRSPSPAPGKGDGVKSDPRTAPVAQGLFDVPLRLRVFLSERFGAPDPSVKFTLWHKAPKYEVDERYLKTRSTTAPFEYVSSAWMPSAKGQPYLGELQRLPETGIKVGGNGANDARDPAMGRMEVCFERAADELKDRDAPVTVECEEGRACRVTATDAVRACGQRAGVGPALLGRAYAQASDAPRQPTAQAPHWVVPSLKTLRALKESGKAVGYTEFFVTSGPLPDLDGADSLLYAIAVNGTSVHVDGWPPEAHRMPFDPRKGLSLEFGLENLDFSGKQGGFETIEIALQFAQGARQLRKEVIALRYVALRDAAECAASGAANLAIRWRATYVQPRQDDVYQIFLLATSSVGAAEDRKARIDAGAVKLDDKEVVAIVRPPLTTNPSYGLALGLRQPTGQVKFTFDDPTSKRLTAAAVQLAKQKSVIVGEPYRRNVGSRREVTPCQPS